MFDVGQRVRITKFSPFAPEWIGKEGVVVSRWSYRTDKTYWYFNLVGDDWEQQCVCGNFLEAVETIKPVDVDQSLRDQRDRNLREIFGSGPT